MAAPSLRHWIRNGVRRCVQFGPPVLERLTFRAYCSRLNSGLQWLMQGEQEIAYAGARVRIDPSEFTGFSAFFARPGSIPEIEELSGLCRQARVFADIGANIGLISLPVAARHPHLEIFAFEPDSRNLRMLEGNVALNPNCEERVTIVPKAAANAGGTMLFLSDDKNFGNGKIVTAESKATREIASIRLDDYFASLGKYPDIVKIDVEGAELLVLQGMTGLLERHPPQTIWLEVHAFQAGDPRQFKAEIRAILKEHGYGLFHPFTHNAWEATEEWPSHFSLLAARPPLPSAN